VLFDLDGTLLDTAGDITVALNRTLAEYGWAPAAQDEVRHMDAQPYPGVAESRRALHGAGLRTAVVTNKQQRFASGLLERLDPRALPCDAFIESLADLPRMLLAAP